VSYRMPEDTDEADSSPPGSSFSSPQGSVRKCDILDLMEDSEGDSIAVDSTSITPPERVSRAGHSLRPFSKLNLSQRALENADEPRRKLKRKALKTKIERVVSDVSNPGSVDIYKTQLRTKREELRHVIATDTASRRYKFFVAKKEYFLPLLPEKNFVRKLVEKAETGSEESITWKKNDRMAARGAGVEPYKALERQPAG
jgi:SWI/SNF-related matrix-associated actin-dependent regulator of chromatin subfamily A member 5